MKKNNGKIIMVAIIILFFFVLSWLIKGGTFSLGLYKDTGYTRLGLLDLVSVVFSSFAARVDYMYLLVVGGCYGVLTQTKIYRKLVDNTASLIKNKEETAMLVITLLMGLYTSMTNEVLTLLFLSPFIITVFLRNNHDKMTAFSAGFGGLLIGVLGITFGTYQANYLYGVTGVSPTDMIWAKIVIFAVTYALYNVFAIQYMRRHVNANSMEDDIYCPLELDESKLKKRHKTKTMSLIIWGIIATILIGMAYISWKDSFNVTAFNELHTSLSEIMVVGDSSILTSLYGVTAKSFGNYDALIFAIFILLIFITIVAIIDRMNINNFIKNFAKGMKKILKVVFVFGLTYSIVIIAKNFPWHNTIVNAMFGPGEPPLLMLVPIAFITQLFTGNLGMFGDIHGSFIAYAYADTIGTATLLWRLGGAIGFIVGPTSYLLLSLLSYLDIPYKDWLKYIWKFLLSFIIAIIIIFIVIIYI